MSRDNGYDDFNIEHDEGSNDSERFSNFDDDYDYSDNVEDGNQDEYNERLKEIEREIEEYERLKSEFKDLKDDITDYEHKIYDAQIKYRKDIEEKNESVLEGINNLKNLIKQRKERRNEVVKKLDYFQRKFNKGSEPRWGVDPQPQLQIDDSNPPSEVMVDVIDHDEPKKSLEGVDLNEVKNRGNRNKRTKKDNSSKQVYKPKELVVDSVRGEVYDKDTGEVLDDVEVSVGGYGKFDSEGKLTGNVPISVVNAPEYDFEDSLSALKLLNSAPGREMYSSKYSTMLNIMRASEDTDSLFDDEGKVKVEHQERARAEYSQLVQEIVLERGELYKVLNKYSSELDGKVIEFIENKIAGLSYLEKELGLLMQRHEDNLLREEETPGSLRAVKDAYANAGYITQIGEGVGQAVHHLDGYNWFTGGRIDPNNLILLSNKIHDGFHDIYGRGNNSLEQFYEFLSNFHSEELPKFEAYLKGMANIDDKLFDASGEWDSETWRKQFNRYLNIPWMANFDEVDIDASVDKIPYSSFFLKNMEIPLKESYKMGDGTYDKAQLSTSSKTVLDIYDLVVEEEKKRYEGIKDLNILRSILHSRQMVESLNNIDVDVVDPNRMSHWSRDKIMKELGESQARGREYLLGRTYGAKLPFLGKEFSLGEDNPFIGTGLGKGLLPVLDRVKKFFDDYSDSFDFKNPLRDWDSSGDFSSNSANVRILSKLFDDEELLDALISHVIRNLPIDNTEGISTAHDPVKARIRRFNEEYYDNPEDSEHSAFREVRADLKYLLGISRGGASIDTIGRFFSPTGVRKPLGVYDTQNAFDFAPKPIAHIGGVGLHTTDTYEAMGYTVVKDGGGGYNLILTRDYWKEVEDNHPSKKRHPYSTTDVSTGRFEEDGGWGLGDEGFSRYDNSIQVDESLLYPKSPSCCERLLMKLGEINETVNTVGKSIENALKNFKGGARGSMYDENGMLNLNNDNSSTSKQEFQDKFYSGYKSRVNELEELLNSTEDENIKKFAEDALSVAKRMDTHGLRKSEWNQDLVYAIFGRYPKRENFSLEEEEKIRGELSEIRKTRKNSTTQKILDAKIKKIDKEIEKVNESTDNYFKDGLYGETISKDRYLGRLESRKNKWENKNVVGEDELKFYELKEEAYKKVLNQPSPTEHYNDHIANYIKAIDGVRGYEELGTRARFLETRGRLSEMGIDVSEEEEKAVAKINRIISSYDKELKGDLPLSKKDEIQEKIDKLNELKSLLDNDGEWWALLPSNDVPNVINDMPIKGSSAFNDAVYNATALLDASDSEIGEIYGREGKYDENTKWHKDSLHSQKVDLENIIESIQTTLENATLSPSRRMALEKSLPKYKQEYQKLLENTSEGETEQFSKTELAYKRFDYLKEKYENTIRIIERFRSNLDLLKDEGGAEQFDALIERLEYFKSELDSLADKDLSSELRKQVQELTDDFYELSKTSERILGDDLLRRAEEASLQSINERNRLGVNALFGDVNAQNELFGEPPVPKTEKAPLEGRLTRMAYNFRQASQSANQFTGVLTKLFSIVGTGNAINDMITASSLRQTNQIMLASRRGMEEAEKLYNRIQMLVVKLPGNDTFLTNILTMLGTMDETLSAEDLEYMGGVIADYYMGAQAKGQFNNETERELRNYLMTGQTRNLTNSIIASEIESLKNLNSVKERTVALEKALKATGMDSIAHYDSYTNSLEEFKGRFQKAFADLGDMYLGLLQGGMKVYNFFDNLTNSLLSQFVIVSAVAVMGILSFIAVMTELLSMSAGLVEAFDSLNKLIKENDKQYSGLAQTFRKVITWIAYKTGVVNAETASTVINTDATIANTISQELNSLSIMENIRVKIANSIENIQLSITAYISMWARFGELDATVLETIAEKGNIKVKIIARLAILKETIVRTINIISILAEAGALWEATVVYLAYTKSKIKLALINAVIIALEWGATIATMALYGATLLLNGALFVVNLLLSPIGLLIVGIVGAVWLLVKAFEGLGQAFGWWTNIGEMFQAIGDGIRRTWDAFVNSEPIQEIMNAFKNLAYTIGVLFNWIGNIGGNIWQTIFGVDDKNTNKAFDIVGVFLEVVGVIGKIIYLISPLKLLVEIMNAIGSAIAWVLDTWNEFTETKEFQDLIKGFQDIRKIISETWDILSKAFGEVKDAFMSIFEDTVETEEVNDGLNLLLELLKAIAWVLNHTIVPVIKIVAYFLKGVAQVIKTIADVISGVIGFFTHTGEYFTNFIMQVRDLIDIVVDEFLSIPKRIMDSTLDGVSGGLYSTARNILFGSENPNNLNTGKQLAQNYNNKVTNSPHIINNHFHEGSVQADARNMTSKDVLRLFTSAFGFNKARGVNGVFK